MHTQTSKTHSPSDIYILMHIYETIIIKEREANNLRESEEDGKRGRGHGSRKRKGGKGNRCNYILINK